MKILIAGLGLIGGSFALALRDREIADEILGVEKSDENAAEALRLGLADRIVTLEEGVPQADLVVLATPVDTIPLMAVKALNHVTDRQVVMDMGSIKAELCEVISMHARRGRFVAAHPMWGTEYSGPRAAQHGAFTGRNAVVCEAQFEWAKPGQRLGQDFLNEALPLIERQIRNAGYRLARVLNELFG